MNNRPDAIGANHLPMDVGGRFHWALSCNWLSREASAGQFATHSLAAAVDGQFHQPGHNTVLFGLKGLSWQSACCAERSSQLCFRSTGVVGHVSGERIAATRSAADSRPSTVVLTVDVPTVETYQTTF